jgi:hypothetical protein
MKELALPGGGASATTDLAQGSIVFVGTATLLLRDARFTNMTDPNVLHRGETYTFEVPVSRR